MLLGNHPNAMVVLNLTWNTELLNKNTLKSVILTSMANFYLKNPDDQGKLTKILEIAHELKPNV
jgi:hypothetical protein